jgi:hypothetical protein
MPKSKSIRRLAVGVSKSRFRAYSCETREQPQVKRLRPGGKRENLTDPPQLNRSSPQNSHSAMKTHELFDLDPYARPRMTFNLPMPMGCGR